MKKIQTVKKLEVACILEYGIDFQDEDMESLWVPELKEIKSDSLKRIAKQYGYDSWSFSDHVKDNQVLVRFYKILEGGEINVSM